MFFSTTKDLLLLLTLFLAASSLPLKNDEFAGKLDHSTLMDILEAQLHTESFQAEPEQDSPGRMFWDYLIDSLPTIKQYLQSLDVCVRIVDELQIFQDSSVYKKGDDDKLANNRVTLCQAALSLLDRQESEELSIEALLDVIDQLRDEETGADRDGYRLQANKQAYSGNGGRPYVLKGVNGAGIDNTKRAYDSIELGPFGLKRAYDSIELGPFGLKRAYDNIGLDSLGLRTSEKEALIQKLNQKDSMEVQDDLLEQLARKLTMEDMENSKRIRD